MKLKKGFLSLFLSLSILLGSITVFASSNIPINIISNETITIDSSEMQYLDQEIVDRLYAKGELDEKLLDELIEEGVFGNIQQQFKPSSRWGIGVLGSSSSGNKVNVKCIGFDVGTLAVEGEVLIMNKAGACTIKPFYISCSGLYNQTRNFNYYDWDYAKITSAVAYGPSGQYKIPSLPKPIKR